MNYKEEVIEESNRLKNIIIKKKLNYGDIEKSCGMSQALLTKYFKSGNPLPVKYHDSINDYLKNYQELILLDELMIEIDGDNILVNNKNYSREHFKRLLKRALDGKEI